MDKKIHLMVVLDVDGNHTVSIAPSDCSNMSEAQEVLTDIGCNDKLVDFISIEEDEDEDLAFGIFELMLKSDYTRGTIERILTIAFLRGMQIPHDVAAGLD